MSSDVVVLPKNLSAVRLACTGAVSALAVLAGALVPPSAEAAAVVGQGTYENDNGAIDTVVKAWASIAKRANCSIVLVHHTKKLGTDKVTAEVNVPAEGKGMIDKVKDAL